MESTPRRLSLDGAWDLAYALAPARPADTPAELADRDDYRIVSAQVPGNVELDLVRAGVLPDPYLGDNIALVTPYELADWWFTREFEWDGTPDDHEATVIFEGLDTFADVFCNDQAIGSSANMLIPHTFTLQDFLQEGSNRLSVHLRSPLRATDEHDYAAAMVGHEERMEMLRARRAPHTYGWDIAPRLLSAGLWRSVTIDARPRTRLAETYLTTRSIAAAEAVLDLWFVVTGWPWGREVRLTVELTAPDGNHVRYDTPLDFRAGHHPVRMADPELWWPKGYGRPALYDASVRLTVDDQEVDRCDFAFGIRTAELIRRPGSPHTPADADLSDPTTPEDFRVVINGVDVYCSGTNWVPLDALHSRDAERWPAASALLDEVGGNIVRCWGGNVYESDAFFDFCDQHGLLVWQDFALACAITPQDAGFAEDLCVEARVIVQRLRQHPSLLLWCGNNENDMFWADHGFDPGQDRIARTVLRDAVFTHDPTRPYVASSPFYATRTYVHSTPRAEDHLWGPRAAFKAPFYTAHHARFVSEIGYHGAPSLRAMRRMIGPGFTAFDPQDPVQMMHSTLMGPRRFTRPYNRIQLMIDQAALHVDFDPTDQAQLVQASQITQAEAFKFFVEQSRITPGRTGLIWWNLLDGWPQISDAVVDYHLEPKLAFYHLKSAQQPVALIAGEADGWQRPVHVANHTNQDVRLIGAIADVDTGETIWEGAADAPAGVVAEVTRLPIARGRDTMLALTWHPADPTGPGVAGANHYLDVAGRVDLPDYLRWLAAYAPAAGIPNDQLWPALPGSR